MIAEECVCLIPPIIPIRADVQLLLDVVKFGMHMFNLGAETPAIVVLNSPTEVTVELPCLGPDMFIVGHDAPVGAVGTHFRPDMVHHSIEMIDLAPEPGDGIPIFVAVVDTTIVAGLVDRFVSLSRINARFVGLFGVMGRCREGESGHAHNRSG